MGDQLEEEFESTWVPSKRFGVVQGEKIRAVDDMSEFLINASVSTSERISLKGLDEVVATSRFFLGALQGKGMASIPQVDGGVRRVPVHEAWSSRDVSDLFGRALDLKSAYNQLARRPNDAWASILAAYDPASDAVKFFKAVALPFGSVSSVLAFNRAARALRTILSRLFMLVNTNFFDDFCQMETAVLQESAHKTAETVMQLLGWTISTSESKRKPFRKVFDMLGATISFEESVSGVVIVSNKEGRLADIRSDLLVPFWLGKCQKFAAKYCRLGLGATCTWALNTRDLPKRSTRLKDSRIASVKMRL